MDVLMHQGRYAPALKYARVEAKFNAIGKLNFVS